LIVVGALACFGAGIALPRLTGIALDHGQSSDRSQAPPPSAGARTAKEPAVEPRAPTAGERKLAKLAESIPAELNGRAPSLPELKLPDSKLPQPK
jgi:hypothetical protein